MILFTVIGIGMVAAALLLILPALLGKANKSTYAHDINQNVLRDQLRELDSDRAAGTLDEVAYASSQRELQQQLSLIPPPVSAVVETSYARLAVLLAVVLPVAVLALYLLLGTPAGLNPPPVAQQPEVSQQQILGMVEKLAQRLAQQPGDTKGWEMLARSYFSLGRYDDATQAYSHLTQLAPDNADYLTSYALAIALKQNKNLQGEPEKLLQRAVDIDPKNIRALSLLGSAAFDRHDYSAAIASWNRVMPLVPADSQIAISTRNSIQEAQALAK